MKLIKVIVLTAFCFVTSVCPEAEGREFVIDVPIQKIRRTPVVQVEAGGQKWNFVVDTGAAWCVGSSAFAAQAFAITNYSSTHHVNAVGFSGEVVKLPVVTIPLLRLAGAPFVNLPLVVSDLSSFSSKNIRVDGLLGFQFFKSYRLTLDYKSGRIRMTPTNTLNSLNTNTIPFALKEGVPAITLVIQGRDFTFIVDSGNSGSLDFPAEQLGLNFVSQPNDGGGVLSIGGVKANRQGRLAGSVAIGALEFVDPIVTSMPENRFYVGNMILEHFTVTFDPGSKNIEFAPNQFLPVKLPPIRSWGLVFGVASNRWVVEAISQDSPELTRAIHLGDRWTRLNGEPISDWSLTQLGDLLEQTNVIRSSFIRQDKEFDIDLPVFLIVP